MFDCKPKVGQYWTLTLGQFSMLIDNGFGWKEPTHVIISGSASNNSVLSTERRDYLKASLGFENGLESYLQWGEQEEKIIRWIQEGSKLEDAGNLLNLAMSKARYLNHFHNPLKPWDQAGLNDGVSGKSLILWSQDSGQSGFPEGDWSWNKIRGDFYSALTSKTEEEKEKYFAMTFRGLGHQMHLIQDAAQPYHVRNDAHPFDDDFHTDDGTDYIRFDNRTGSKRMETWAKDNPSLITSLASGPISPTVSLNVSPLSTSAPVAITQLVDSDRGSAPSTSLNQGLSEYTNANFFSEDTIFAGKKPVDDKHYFRYPSDNGTDVKKFLDGEAYPETVYAEDQMPDLSFWIAKNDEGEQITHFVKPTYHTRELHDKEGKPDSYGVWTKTFHLDEKCHEDYVTKLIPRAAGYSAALLNYFFRGQVRMTSQPLIISNKIFAIRAKIENVTPTGESMKDARAIVTCHYRPSGADSDVFVQSPTVASGLLLETGKEGTEVDFYFPDSSLIPLENYDSVKCSLALKGTLGYEQGAVIGKVFSPGEMKFNEEWDNGLIGNHNWGHTGLNYIDNKNPDNGITWSGIENGVLVKENIRFSEFNDEWGSRYNSSFIGNAFISQFTDIMFPIPITRNTYVQFKIDSMSITPGPYGADGKSNGYQRLTFIFNNNLKLDYSQEGQNGVLGGSSSTTGYFTFHLGWIIIDNIYKNFESCGIQIPEPLYLDAIYLGQQIFGNEGTEYHQHMEVDFIRVIEEKKE